MKNKKLNDTIKISLLGVIAFIIQFFEIPLPIFPSFVKLDFSDIPAILGTFAIGPIAGVLIEFIKNILHGLIINGSAFIGEGANFIVGSAFVIGAGLVYKRKKTRKNALIALLTGTICMTIAGAAGNYFVFLPLYETVLGFKISTVVSIGHAVNPHINNLNSLIIWSFVPFNALKGIIMSIVTLLIYKKLSPVLHK